MDKDKNKGKVLCIIQARMGSERLPGKAMMDICGKPMIMWVIERLKYCKNLNKIILATTEKAEDSILCQVAIKCGVEYFTGSEHDVLRRYLDAAMKFDGEIIVRITGDCPLVDPFIIDELIADFMESDCDYMRLDVPDTFPRGSDGEIFTIDALKRANDIANEDKYREHVTLIMYQRSDIFSICKKKANGKLQRPQYRFCVDTAEDLELVRQIYTRLYKTNELITAEEVIDLLDQNPNLWQMNSQVKQRI